MELVRCVPAAAHRRPPDRQGERVEGECTISVRKVEKRYRWPVRCEGRQREVRAQIQQQLTDVHLTGEESGKKGRRKSVRSIDVAVESVRCERAAAHRRPPDRRGGREEQRSTERCVTASGVRDKRVRQTAPLPTMPPSKEIISALAFQDPLPPPRTQ